jgi:outer membrane protein OmpA-like peptidoglycan-associated protein
MTSRKKFPRFASFWSAVSFASVFPPTSLVIVQGRNSPDVVTTEGGLMRPVAFKLFCIPLGALAFAISSYPQETEKLKVSVDPGEAYTFVDGKAIGPGNRTIKLPLGTHNVIVANYGFKFFQQDVALDSGKPTTVKVKLEPSGSDVPGPFGRIQIELGRLSLGDAGDHAVLLNGKTANYFVGHVDEFNNNIVWRQELVVPPGNHQITVTRRGNEVWSGTISVAANQRVIVDISNGKQKVKDWSAGSKNQSLPRFTAGMASARVTVAPVSSEISVSPSKIDCGQPSQLKWTSAETIDADISGMSPVPVNGDKTVSPKQTTTYDFTATGPGGVTKSSATVDVNTVVQSSVSVSPTEVRYRRIGDKTLESGNATVAWSSSNSDAASLTPFGSVGTTGSKSVPMTPTQTTDGPVDETFKYTLTATNACGGSETKTAAVHLTGSIEPIPEVLLQSVFFPTDYPTKQDPTVGLVQSQQAALTTLATGFTKYLEYDPGAKLSLAAHADERGPNTYNQDLSERRVQSVKDFLISRGIAEDKIDTSVYGDDKPLEKSTVIELQGKNPDQPTETRVRNFRSTWLAYNRRVDVALLPTNRESLQFYPNSAPDSETLWQRPKPAVSAVQNQ